MKLAMIALGSTLLIASACATTKQAQGPSSNASAYAVEQDPSEGNPDDVLFCDWEHVVGTNVRQRVCWEQAALDHQREYMQTWMDAYLHVINTRPSN